MTIFIHDEPVLCTRARGSEQHCLFYMLQHRRSYKYVPANFIIFSVLYNVNVYHIALLPGSNVVHNSNVTDTYRISNQTFIEKAFLHLDQFGLPADVVERNNLWDYSSEVEPLQPDIEYVVFLLC